MFKIECRVCGAEMGVSAQDWRGPSYVCPACFEIGKKHNLELVIQ